MTFVFNPSKWKPLTKKLAVLIAMGSISTQSKWVTDHVLPIVDTHPHLTFLGPLLLGGLALIHNPVAQNIAKEVFTQEQSDDQGNLEKKTTEITTETTPKQ
jgi:hypothetical protein